MHTHLIVREGEIYKSMSVESDLCIYAGKCTIDKTVNHP